MIEVVAVSNGYYGGKVRTPGEKFGINDADDFSIEWMASDDPKVKANIRARAKAKPAEDATREERRMIEARVARYRDWLKADHDMGDEDDGVETRRVNTGGTDGIVGEEVPKQDTAKRKKAAKKAAPVPAVGGSDNDDRSRDMAIDQTANAPAPDWEQPRPADD